MEFKAMPASEQERFQTDLAIALTLVRQRRAWIFRDLTHRDRSKADAARTALIGEVMAVAADYEPPKVERFESWP